MKMKARLFASAKISPGIRRTPSMCTGNHTKLGMRSPSSNTITIINMNKSMTKCNKKYTDLIYKNKGKKYHENTIMFSYRKI